MKLSLNWVREFVELPDHLSNLELVEAITLSVCEVETFEESGQHLPQIIAVKVLEIQPHPDADKLCLVEIDTAAGKKEIVCGAHNFKVGDLVPFAGEGVTLPDGLTIKLTKIRGIASEGMLLAEDELGFGEDHNGLMILPPGSSAGQSLDKIFPDQMDVILEIDNKSITHRPDLWGHYGFARELGCVYRVPVKSYSADPATVQGKGNKLIEVEVESPDLVPRFCGLSISEVHVCESPDWIRYRLFRVGLRPINNLVDLTNYVMLELGQPMHAFDADQITGKKLIVRLTEKDSKVMTLYQKEVELNEEDLTICDSGGPLVVAGVIGGLNSGVTEQSTALFLEAANWNPVAIRKTSTKIGLRTDASQRYEKGLDPEITDLAIARAVELLGLSNPDFQVCGDWVDIRGLEVQPITVVTSVDFINRRLGKVIDDGEILDILNRLGFKVNSVQPELIVEVPTHRRTNDVSIPEDLVEEIGRIHGYNHIPPQTPFFPIEKPVINKRNAFERSITHCLWQSGFHEALSYPLTCEKEESLFHIHGEETLRIINPVSDHQNRMRSSLLPHFVKALYNNQKINLDFKMFEIGRVYGIGPKGEIEEPRQAVLGLSQHKDKLGGAFYSLKSVLIHLLSKLKIGEISWKPLQGKDLKDYCHSRVSAGIFAGETFIGSIYSFSPKYFTLLELREDVCMVELDLEKIFNLDRIEFQHDAPPKYPAVLFELSVVVPSDIYYRQVEDIIRILDNRITKIEFLVDYQLPEKPGYKSMSISMEFRSADKTLNPEEVKVLQDRVISGLGNQGFSLREG